MNPEKSRCSPINHTQKEMLIEFLRQNEKLQSGKFTSDFTFKKAQQLWEKISSSLNSVPGGAKKEWRQWRKTWQDLKKNVKGKLVREKTYSSGTGGGPSATIRLDDTDNSILEMVSTKVTYGDTSVKLPEVNFQFLEEDNAQMCSTPNALTPLTEEDILLEEVEVNTDEVGRVDRAQKMYTDHKYHLKPVSKPLSKITKTRRLENSLKISQEMLKIEDEKKNVENFYQEKINYLNHRQVYEREKLETLKRANFLREEILEELKMMKQQFLQEE